MHLLEVEIGQDFCCRKRATGMAGFGRKDLRENAFAHLTSNLFKVDVHVISFHVLRARTAAGRHHARAGAACESALTDRTSR